MKKPLPVYAANLDAERTVLASILLDDRCMAEIRSLLRPEQFHRDSYRRIFTVMCEVHDKGLPIDTAILADSLRFKAEINSGGRTSWLQVVGGVTALSELTEGESFPWNVRHYCEIIIRDYRYRQFQKIFSDAQRRVEEWAEPTDEVLADTVGQLSRLQIENGARIAESVGDVAGRVLDRVEAVRSGRRIPEGLKTGIPTWDGVTNGLQRQWLVLLAAMPGMFKTAMLLQIALDAALRQGLVGLFVNFEMSKEELTDRMMAQWSGVPLFAVQNPLEMTDAEYLKFREAREEIKSGGLNLGDGMLRDAMKILAECQRIKATTGRFDFLVVDYIQRMRPVNRPRDLREAITEISNDLKDISIEMDCPVIAVSSMNRDGYDDPKLSSLKESGMLEYDANQVLFLKNKVELNGGFFEIELECQKSRGTRTFHTSLVFDGARQRFAEKEYYQ